MGYPIAKSSLKIPFQSLALFKAYVGRRVADRLSLPIMACMSDSSPKNRRSRKVKRIESPAKPDDAMQGLKCAGFENREPTVQELEPALRKAGLIDRPDVVQKLHRMIKNEAGVEPARCIARACKVLRQMQKFGGAMEVEAITGFLEMALLAIEGLDGCSLESRRLVAIKRNDWPVMMELGGEDYRKVIDVGLRRIQLGKEVEGKVSANALIQHSDFHKSIATQLFLTVKGILDSRHLQKHEQILPQRFFSLREDAEENYKELIRRLGGYSADKWQPDHKRDFDSKLENLKLSPEVNSKSFPSWFAACRALLVCITHDQFHLPCYKLREKGENRAQKWGADSKFKAEAYYKKGIGESLKSSLMTVLKVRRRKQG